MRPLIVLGNEGINVLINIALFSIIPFLWYVLSKKGARGFFRYLGIYIPHNLDVVGSIKIILPIYLITLTMNILVIATGNSQRSTGGVEQNVWWFFLIGLFLYGLKTGIAEEIFFRGFIAKRSYPQFGFFKGNLVQASIFALPHVVIHGPASPLDIAVRIVNAFMLGYAFGYIVEKKSSGSILPVMTAHTIINILNSSILIAILHSN